MITPTGNTGLFIVIVVMVSLGALSEIRAEDSSHSSSTGSHMDHTDAISAPSTPSALYTNTSNNSSATPPSNITLTTVDEDPLEMAMTGSPHSAGNHSAPNGHGHGGVQEMAAMAEASTAPPSNQPKSLDAADSTSPAVPHDPPSPGHPPTASPSRKSSADMHTHSNIAVIILAIFALVV